MDNNKPKQQHAPAQPAATQPPQQPLPAQNAGNNQQFYVQQAVPVEAKTKNPGKKEGIIAIVLAALSLLFFPPIFGTVGIVLGVMAYRKGQKTLGLVAIILSAVFMVIGMILGVAVNVMLKHSIPAKGAVSGYLLP